MSWLLRNKFLFAFIVSAFLAVQWSSVHIHLAMAHDHGGAAHQHSSQGHSHRLSNHHSDAIDVAHADAHDNVVELGLECTSPWLKKLDDHADVLPGCAAGLATDVVYHVLGVAAYRPPPPSRYFHTSVRPRAPPLLNSLFV